MRHHNLAQGTPVFFRSRAKQNYFPQPGKIKKASAEKSDRGFFSEEAIRLPDAFSGDWSSACAFHPTVRVF